MSCNPVIIDYEINEEYVYDLVDTLFETKQNKPFQQQYASPVFMFETMVPGISCKY